MRRRTARELTALADGTLRPGRRDALLRRVSSSPKLARALGQQLAALEAIRGLDTPAPMELRERIERTICQAPGAPQSGRPTERRPGRGAPADR